MGMKTSEGFSLMETMIVLLILSIIVTIGLPSIGRSSRAARLSGAADEIISAIDYARVTAMNSGCSTMVTMDDSNDSIRVRQFLPWKNLLGTETVLDENDVENGHFVTMEHPLNRGTDYYIIFSDEARFNSVDIVSSVFDSHDYVIFSSSGTPSSGGSVTITCGDLRTVLNLDSTSGMVTKS